MKCWAGRIINWNQDCQEKYHLRYVDDFTLVAENEEEVKNFLMRVKEESEVGLKHNIQKTKIMVSRPITSWKIQGKKVEAVIFYFLGLQNHCGQ